ncbi:MAG: S9 family peptidase [Actinomycetaceae bacterium]|nr:S9 family peptidase [Actinomycetaceae bacterium]
MTNIYPYGTWPSPLDVSTLTTKKRNVSYVTRLMDATMWLEALPEDDGMSSLVIHHDNDASAHRALPDLPGATPSFIGTKVHEYGGKAYDVHERTVIFSSALTGQVYLYHLGSDEPIYALTPPDPTRRYADFFLTDHAAYAVCEEHHDGQVDNYLVQMTWNNNLFAHDNGATPSYATIDVLFHHSDFVTSPQLSPCGKFLAFISWDHPAMPWTHSRLHVINLSSRPRELHTVVDSRNVSVAQPLWAPDGTLLHIDDSTGWANIYRTEGFLHPHPTDNPHLAWHHRLRTRSLHPCNDDYMPNLWALGGQSMAIFDSDHIVATWQEKGRRAIGLLRIDNGQCEVWPLEWEPEYSIAAKDGTCVLIAHSNTSAPCVIKISSGRVEVLASSSDVVIDPESISEPQLITWPVTSGGDTGISEDVSHGFFYLPQLAGVSAGADEKPPLLVHVHGGPTSTEIRQRFIDYQWWTTRGFAVLVVNYRGSTGFGRAYQDALNGNWGVSDVADCEAGVRYLVDKGLVDPARVAIRGGSAGGYTTLRALSVSDVFSAGCSLYGVADLRSLAAQTHKFESQYLQGLIGSSDDGDDVWDERSPANTVENIKAPLLLLQGQDDAIVPPNQATMMQEALQRHGITVELRLFSGEGHGFVHDDTIAEAFMAELEFYLSVWNII